MVGRRAPWKKSRAAPRFHGDTRINKLALELIPFRSQRPPPRSAVAAVSSGLIWPGEEEVSFSAVASVSGARRPVSSADPAFHAAKQSHQKRAGTCACDCPVCSFTYLRLLPNYSTVARSAIEVKLLLLRRQPHLLSQSPARRTTPSRRAYRYLRTRC